MRVPPTPPDGRGPVWLARQFRVALGGVARVRGQQLGAVDRGLGRAHAARGFEARHPDAEFAVDQPVARRHRRSVVEQRRVPDHDRPAVCVANDDRERGARLADRAVR